MTVVENSIYDHDLLGAKGYARLNHSHRSENECCGEGVHRPVAARLGSTAWRHGPRWSYSTRGSSAWKVMRLRAKQRAVHGDSYLGQR
jgi:hypothetical protein